MSFYTHGETLPMAGIGW